MTQNPEIGRRVRTGGFETNVHDVGSGAPVLLIHGSGPGVSAWANWRLVIPALAKGRRVIAPDMVGFGYSTWFPLSLGLLALSGMFDMVSVVIRSTLLQARTPEGLLGRVSSVNQIFIGSSNEIGMFESGITAKWWGASRAVVIGGLATLGVVGTVALTVPTLRRLRRLHPEERHGV